MKTFRFRIPLSVEALDWNSGKTTKHMSSEIFTTISVDGPSLNVALSKLEEALQRLVSDEISGEITRWESYAGD